MCYQIEIFEEKIVLTDGDIVKEILNKDVKSAKIYFRDNTRAKLLLLACVSGVFIAIYLGLNLGFFSVSLILLLLSYVLFFEFDKCSADLTLVTKRETIKFNVQTERMELSFLIIDTLHLKNYKACTKSVYLYERAA